MDISFNLLLFRLAVLLACLSTTRATLCPHCNADYACLGRHIWRCSARITMSTNTNVAPIMSPARAAGTGSLNSAALASSPDPSVPWKCVCGRPCRGRHGFRSHQRSCRAYAALAPDLTSGINSTGAPSASTSASQDHSTSLPSTSPTREQPTILLGVKLPKTPLRWLEGNAYFASLSALRAPISDINSYTSLLQKSIYEYFATNYGQISPACQDDAYGQIVR